VPVALLQGLIDLLTARNFLKERGLITVGVEAWRRFRQ